MQQYTHTDKATDRPTVAAFLGNIAKKMHSKKKVHTNSLRQTKTCAHVRDTWFLSAESSFGHAFYT